MWQRIKDKFLVYFTGQYHIAPLVTLRILFGALMFISTVRFILKGWVISFYVLPQFHFTFYGFEWIKPLSAAGMYGIFTLMLLSALFICIGLFYRIAAITFFLCFTYVELIDKTYYLNHYYFVSLISFLLILVPANRYFSVDVLRKPASAITHVPAWTISIFKLQLIIIYLFAGFSKITGSWLLNAMPLKIWLPANANLPIIGFLLTKEWMAYLFSWFGALFDLTICFFLLNKTTRVAAYIMVIVFHIATALLFKIGMFPYIMILATVIFFSENAHIKFIQWLCNLFAEAKVLSKPTIHKPLILSPLQNKITGVMLLFYFLLQVFIPLRFLLYPGNLLWTEEGFRFSWRVMLMEKTGTVFFYVKDASTGTESEIDNSEFLTPMQEKMMATQPDMILQYAHYLKSQYLIKGIKHPVVTAKSYVTLNGSGSRPFIDSNIDLACEEENFNHKKWILSSNHIN